jgi:predicted NBD/HSP70 family sugar kinase
MHLLGEFDRLPVGNYFSGGAQMNYVGIDHHRQYSHMTLMDEQGNIVRSRKVSNLRSEVKEFLEGVKDCCAVIVAWGESDDGSSQGSQIDRQSEGED